MFMRTLFFSLALASTLLAESLPKGVVVSAVGVTRQDQPIPVWLGPGDLDYSTNRRRLLLVGPAASVRAAMNWFYGSPAGRGFREGFVVSAIPIESLQCGCPPPGEFYQSPTNVEAQYLWRWIGVHAPDKVVVFGKSGLA